MLMRAQSDLIYGPVAGGFRLPGRGVGRTPPVANPIRPVANPIRPVSIRVPMGVSTPAPVNIGAATTTASGSSGYSTGCSTCDQRAQAAASWLSANPLIVGIVVVALLVAVLK